MDRLATTSLLKYLFGKVYRSQFEAIDALDQELASKSLLPPGVQ